VALAFNLVDYTAIDTEIRFVAKFVGNRPLQSSRKVVWFTTQKKLAALVTTQFCPKWADRAQNYLSTYTEFGPDRLRFAGLIPERLIFWPKKPFNIGFQPTNMEKNYQYFTCHRYNIVISKNQYRRYIKFWWYLRYINPFLVHGLRLSPSLKLGLKSGLRPNRQHQVKSDLKVVQHTFLFQQTNDFFVHVLQKM